MSDSCGCGMPPEGRSRFRTFLVGAALAAATSFTGAFGFTSTALRTDNGQLTAGTQANPSTCLCGSGGPCCGFCGPAKNQVGRQ